MPDDIENSLRQNAQGPVSAEADGVKATQHRLPDQIETDKYLAAKGAMSRRNFGLTRAKIIPPGTV